MLIRSLELYHWRHADHLFHPIGFARSSRSFNTTPMPQTGRKRNAGPANAKAASRGSGVRDWPPVGKRRDQARRLKNFTPHIPKAAMSPSPSVPGSGVLETVVV